MPNSKSQITNKVRVRIAPSPTGFPHVGTAYAALFNWAYAKKNKGSFIIRLEDTDLKRNVKGAEGAIYASLEWLGLDWDEGPDKGGQHGPYRQSERLALYREKAQLLLKRGFAVEDEGAVRFRNPGKKVFWNDLVRGEISFSGEEIGDFVLIKSDGYPAYNFAVVVDDILMEITHVIRGEEHISNTPRQLAVYKAFGTTPPFFAHLPTLRNKDKKKLSKRRDPVDLRLFRKEGYLPQALVNFLSLLGWSHPEEKEVFPISEFVEELSLERIRKAGPVFDTQKLDWLNGIYIRQTENKELVRLINEFIPGDISPDLLSSVVPLVKERINKLSQAESLLSFFWKRPQLGKKLFEGKSASLHISSALLALGRVKKWSLVGINRALSKNIKKHKFKTGSFYMSLRLALTGKTITPPINESMVVLGQDEVIRRLEEAEKVLLEQ